MIHSMTAFSHRALQSDWGTAVWEIRSVNHRYLDIVIRLPEAVRDLEPTIRERIRQKIQRGKLEVFLKYTPQADSGPISINTEIVNQLAQASGKIQQMFPAATAINTMDVLTWPGVLNTAEINRDHANAGLLQLFDLALNDLIVTRKREGEAIYQVITKRLTKILELVNQVKQRFPVGMENQRKKLLARFEEARISLDPERLEQEMLLMAQKIDIAEEMDRLEIHVQETQKTLQQADVVGRRLDFLMQEMHREANTLAAKSIDPEISSVAVELRVIIEQMREQVQNIE